MVLQNLLVKWKYSPDIKCFYRFNYFYSEWSWEYLDLAKNITIYSMNCDFLILLTTNKFCNTFSFVDYGNLLWFCMCVDNCLYIIFSLFYNKYLFILVMELYYLFFENSLYYIHKKASVPRKFRELFMFLSYITVLTISRFCIFFTYL